jgi:DNA-directed RNA polymerase alpha subunit
MITILENTDKILKFKCSRDINILLTTPLHHTLCNSLRRIMISEIKTYAIEIVSILKNNSILVDAIFSHRLGLIPIKVLENDPEKLANLKITLQVSFDPKKADIFGVHTVYASEFEYDHKLISIDPNLIVVKLLKNQEIDLDAMLAEGTGVEHAKWNAVSVASTTECSTEQGSYIFLIESIGPKKPIDIFIEAVEILKNKVDLLEQ